MDRKPAIKIDTRALGDTICSIPVLNKLAKAYEQPLTVFTAHPILFKNHPSVLETKGIDDNTEGYTLHKTCIFDNIKMHNNIDIRQFNAWDIGISLTTDELECDMYCEDTLEIDVTKYVIIHPSKTWESRTWSEDNWQKLTNKLINNNIPVVIVGSSLNQKEWCTNELKWVNKDICNIEGGINLINSTSIPELRYIMNNHALCVVTADSGILHVAGSTDCEIIQLGSSFNHKLRAPWRKSSQDYKYQYIKGECEIACGSNMKYGLKEWNAINGIPPLANCLEGYTEFKCHSKVDDVFNSILKLKNS